MSVGAVAPTGKAAVRITEVMTEKKLYVDATTIHTCLKPVKMGYDGQGWSFRHCRMCPLPFDLLVCDESSMVDTELMSDLLGAVQRGSQVLLVGDPYQLPPVGPGRPFCDFINAGLPHGHLTEIHRFAGRIAKVCQQIRDGERWEPSERVDLSAEFPENMRHVECHSSQVVPALLSLIPKLKDYGFNSPDQIQIICPCNSAGSLSRERLNIVLQDHWNASGLRAEGNSFRVGDKVMIKKNSFYPEGDYSSERSGTDHYVANGEIGRVVMNSSEWTEAMFGNRVIRIKSDFEKPPVQAWAVTIHNSQGSQWPCVIAIADSSGAADRVCNRSLWYTGISRAGKLAVTIGQRAAIDRHCAVIALDQRKTFLTERIRSAKACA